MAKRIDELQRFRAMERRLLEWADQLEVNRDKPGDVGKFIAAELRNPDGWPMTATPPPIPAGSLRVWWIPQVPGKPFHASVTDLAQAKLLLATLARYDLFQFEHRIKPDYANAEAA